MWHELSNQREYIFAQISFQYWYSQPISWLATRLSITNRWRYCHANKLLFHGILPYLYNFTHSCRDEKNCLTKSPCEPIRQRKFSTMSSQATEHERPSFLRGWSLKGIKIHVAMSVNIPHSMGFQVYFNCKGYKVCKSPFFTTHSLLWECSANHGICVWWL